MYHMQAALSAAHIPPAANWTQVREHYLPSNEVPSHLDTLKEEDRRHVFVEWQTQQRKERAFKALLASATPAIEVRYHGLHLVTFALT